MAALSETRQTTLLSSFIAALTRGGPSGYPRPIELHAHDPLRYVGDMLAWVHQTIAAEREFLESLFGMKQDNRMVGSVRKFDSMQEEEEWIRELMDHAVGKLCVPLKVGVSVIPILMFPEVDRKCTGASSADHSLSGEQYRRLQNCKSPTILFDDNESDNWRGSSAVIYPERVRPICAALCIRESDRMPPGSLTLPTKSSTTLLKARAKLYPVSA